jgi:exodeoxyribonuclease VII small subunit
MDNKEKSFEEALARLEEIVTLLDSGNAPLDQSLALFEEGAGLVKLCSAKLDNVEQRVKILVAGNGGELEENDFKPVSE